MVAVHDQDEIPLVESSGIAVSAGTEARIALQRKETQNLEPPHHLSVCGAKELKYFDTFSKNKCQMECLIDHIMEVCGCVEPYMAEFATGKIICGVVEVFECSEPHTRDFSVGEECTCPIPCNVTQFVPNVSTAKFPSDFYAGRLAVSHFGSNKATSYFGTNLVLLEVYYEDTTIERSTQYETYCFFGFLCDFGGALSLWLGGSILTLLEIVEHVYYTMFVNSDVPTYTK
ncbi:acid-sensing ion channel 1C-like [Asterias amurensis]|uniref:acid-sensing ion channel 1C-like n=1 Tax=Asterias amurensis TaxID=7602 RepID=UPI003AB6DA67